MLSKKCVKCKNLFYKPSTCSNNFWKERKFCSKRCANSRPSTRKGKTYQYLWRNNVTYGQLHSQVKKKYGKPKKCSHCGSIKNIQWANKSNKYKDNNDFIELCASCHKKYDIKMNNRIVWNKGKKLHYDVWNKGKTGIMPEPWNKSNTCLICPMCKKEFFTNPSAVKAGKKFCSKECYRESPNIKIGGYLKSLRGKWSVKFDKCVSCQLTKNKHQGKGLCAKCYLQKYHRAVL